jgi:hypothetical protein
MMNNGVSLALAEWQSALQVQHDAETKLADALHRGDELTLSELYAEVDALRLHADLLLADAVKTMRSSHSSVWRA